MVTGLEERTYTPYSDVQSRSLILQLKDNEPSASGTNNLRKYVGHSLDSLLGVDKVERGDITVEEAAENTQRLLGEMDIRVRAFKYTTEYLQAKKEEQERIQSYKAIEVTKTVPEGINAEIIENPFRFLNLPRDASYGQTRVAWITLSKLWYPDLVHPENLEQYDRIFANADFPIADESSKNWMVEFRGRVMPTVRSVDYLEKGTEQEREDYGRAHAEYDRLQAQYDLVKEEMRRVATEKIKIINKAWEEAKKQFSDSEREQLVGFNWESSSRRTYLTLEEHDLEALFDNTKSGEEHQTRKDADDSSHPSPFYFDISRDYIDLEGQGQIRIDTYDPAWNQFPYLGFDYGVDEGGDYDYRQRVNLREFFAWMELSQSRELSPSLLDDMVDFYDFDVDQTERLRQMMTNLEDPKLIMEAMDLGQKKSVNLESFLESVYGGPKYFLRMGFDGYPEFSLGVEMTDDGRMILRYESMWDMRETVIGIHDPVTTHFSPKDLQMMAVIAYGPMLTAGKQEAN